MTPLVQRNRNRGKAGERWLRDQLDAAGVKDPKRVGTMGGEDVRGYVGGNLWCFEFKGSMPGISKLVRALEQCREAAVKAKANFCCAFARKKAGSTEVLACTTYRELASLQPESDLKVIVLAEDMLRLLGMANNGKDDNR